MNGRVSVCFQIRFTYVNLPDQDVRIDGDPNDSVKELLIEMLSARGTPFSNDWLFLSWPHGAHRTEVTLDASVTLGQLHRMFGPDLLSDPPVLRVDDGGRGGGGSWLDALDVANAVMNVTGYVAAASAASRAAKTLRYRKPRELARDWEDTDKVSLGLERYVKANDHWPRKLFDSTFGLSRHRGSQLLRELGYVRVKSGFREVWWEMESLRSRTEIQ